MKVFPVFYFPPISWFSALLGEKEVLFEQHNHYRKQGFLNRMRIQGANQIMNLSIPIRRRGENVPLFQSQISYDQDWQRDQWKGLLSAYRNSPFFEYYEHLLEPFFQSRETSLLQHNLNILSVILPALEIEVKFNLSDSYVEETGVDADYRNAFDSSGLKLPDWFEPQPYVQVFRNFEPDLSIIDLLCNEGPAAPEILALSRKYR